MIRKSQKEYYKKKYHTDEEYKKKRIVDATSWAKTHRVQINATNRKHYANRTPEQIENRKQQLKKMRDSGKWKC